ncbi:hypothetical protein [Poriferisphaera sp. WC338]|uniref:hypothetical protein n=1 Tax=Poriferisphaera sp. WC338 TaxID=3425129 RepID=UPI003D819069
MADDNAENTAEAPKKKMPIKTFIAVFAVLLIEAVAITAVFMLSGSPDPVTADSAAIDEAANGEKSMEMLLVQDKFQNTRTGRAYLYDAAINIVIKNKNEGAVTEIIDANKARIEADISNIYRKAEPAHLMEFELSTLKRQIMSVLTNRFGMDPEDNEPYIHEIVMRQKRYRAD